MKIHFIGIGGIGMSALARYFLARGDEVSGSDTSGSEITEELEKLGVKIFVGHKAENIAHQDLVIFSAAVQEDNPELIEARKQGIKCQKYAQALGEITKEKFTIAVSGMHGKSTTTAMIGFMMEKAGLDPTVIVGTKVNEWGNSNFRAGQSQYLVIEADEYDRSFLNYWPKILVLLNIEEEHLDTYTGGLPDIMKTFGEYISHLSADGVLVANEEDENINKIFNFQFSIFNDGSKPKFQIEKYNSKNERGLKLKIPGRHNIGNANAALAVAKILGISDSIADKALDEFNGTWRRMEYKGKFNGAKIYDDYGHHPTEIKATLKGALELLNIHDVPRREIGDKFFSDLYLKSRKRRLWCVFQPHQYHRTYDLFDQFVGAFADADKTIILPIYSVVGRESEEIKKRVSSEKLVEAISKSGKDILFMKDFNKTAEHLKKNLKPGDVCIIMGAGDIYKLTGQLI